MINFDQNSIGRHHLVELMLYPMLQVACLSYTSVVLPEH